MELLFYRCNRTAMVCQTFPMRICCNGSCRIPNCSDWPSDLIIRYLLRHYWINIMFSAIFHKHLFWISQYSTKYNLSKKLMMKRLTPWKLKLRTLYIHVFRKKPTASRGKSLVRFLKKGNSGSDVRLLLVIYLRYVGTEHQYMCTYKNVIVSVLRKVEW